MLEILKPFQMRSSMMSWYFEKYRNTIQNMTLREFNQLNHSDRLFIVVDQGIFLDNYVTKDIRMNLYAVDKFFVELVYDSEENKIIEVRSFKAGPELEKYSGSTSF